MFERFRDRARRFLSGEDPMFERFTDRARKALALANQEAQHLDCEYLGTEHLLLGLLWEGSGVGATVLRDLGLDIKKVRAEVEKLVAAKPNTIVVSKLPQTTHAKEAIQYAIEEARALNHNYVGTEHLLLGLVRETEGRAAQVLTNLGLQLPAVRQAVLNMLGAGAEDAPMDAGLKIAASVAPAKTPVRLAESVHKALRLADQEARRFNQEYVGAEHLLVGLAKEGSGVAATALRNLGLDAQRLHREIEKLAQRGPHVVIMGQLPKAPQVKDMLGYAREEARLHHCPLAGTGHVLLGLLGEAGGVVAQIIANLGLQLEDVRQGVLDLHAAGIQDTPGDLEPMATPVYEEGPSGFGPGPHEGPRQSYRDLPVWQKADELARQVYAITGGFPKEQGWDVASQFRKTALSIPPAIAETHRCQNKPTARWFLYGALAALADVQYLVLFSSRLGHLKDEDVRSVKNLVEDLDRELRRFCGSLES